MSDMMTYSAPVDCGCCIAQPVVGENNKDKVVSGHYLEYHTLYYADEVE